jgi:hypothetical protein
MSRLGAIHNEDFLEEFDTSPEVELTRQEPRRSRSPADAHALSRRGRRRTSTAFPTLLIRDALFGVVVGAVLLAGLALGLKTPGLVEQLLQWLAP